MRLLRVLYGFPFAEARVFFSFDETRLADFGLHFFFSHRWRQLFVRLSALTIFLFSTLSFYRLMHFFWVGGRTRVGCLLFFDFFKFGFFWWAPLCVVISRIEHGDAYAIAE